MCFVAGLPAVCDESSDDIPQEGELSHGLHLCQWNQTVSHHVMCQLRDAKAQQTSQLPPTPIAMFSMYCGRRLLL